MKPSEFHQQSQNALADEYLQATLANMKDWFATLYQQGVADTRDFDSLRQYARQIKDHTLDHLDHYLLRFEAQAKAQGTVVHWASSPESLNSIVLQICQRVAAQRIIKGKSMVSEECHLNEALLQAGMEVVETDLGEYIIQLAEEPPSHIIAPAIHKSQDQVRDLFAQHHGPGQRETVQELVSEARQVLRQKFLQADVGIIGTNFLIAESGSIGLVTNEGNGDLASILPKVQIVTASIEKVVPRLEDAGAMLRLLVRSVLGKPISSYLSLYSGPRRPNDPDGAEEMHVILLDHRRSDILAGPYRDMLRCIRCSACLNHCPVYTQVGGHAYGAVYPGPMGSVLTPLMEGLAQAHHLPNACTDCGRCAEVCPVEIPLPDLLRQLRGDEGSQKLSKRRWRWGLALYMWLASKPVLFRLTTRLVARVMAFWGRKSGSLQRFPPAGGWMLDRDLAAPQGKTFAELWQEQEQE